MPRASTANSDLFAATAADILTRLFTIFPEPRDLYSHLKYETILAGQDPEQMERVWIATVRWLKEEGYIRCADEEPEPDNHSVFRDAVLSARGLAALRQTPAGSSGAATRGDRLLQLTSGPGSAATRNAIRQIIDQILGEVPKDRL